jgi:maltose O-acetyltransferase
MISKIKLYRRILFGYIRYIFFRFGNYKLKVGSGFYSASGCKISRGRDIVIGDNFFMGYGCHLGASASIGNDVMFASNVALVGGDHKIDNIKTPMRLSGRDLFKTIVIEDNVWVGHAAIIMHGVHIESGAVIGAGSVVTKNVSKNAIVAGNPARLIRYRKLSSE